MGEIVIDSQGSCWITGTGSFELYDLFKDPTDLLELYTYARNVLGRQLEIQEIREDELSQIFRDLFEPSGTPFEITGGWTIDINIPIA